MNFERSDEKFKYFQFLSWKIAIMISNYKLACFSTTFLVIFRLKFNINFNVKIAKRVVEEK